MQKTELLIPGSSRDWQSFEWMADWRARCKQWITNILIIVACGLAFAIGVVWGLGLRLMLDIL